MTQPSKAQLESARAKYPPGTRVELPNGMDDEYSPIPAGTRGTVVGVDDMLGLMVDWDNGSSLNVIIGHDNILIVPAAMPDEVRNELLRLRTLPNCPNMFSINEVQRLAFDNGMYSAVDWIENNRKAYVTFILTGKPS